MDMRIINVTFMGTRTISEAFRESLEKQVETMVELLLDKEEYVRFFIGRHGEFDLLVAEIIKKVQKSKIKRNSDLILVLPYKVKDLAAHVEYYDDVIIPIAPETNYKRAIIERNKWMIDTADICFFHISDVGNTIKMCNYARGKGKKTVLFD